MTLYKSLIFSTTAIKRKILWYVSWIMILGNDKASGQIVKYFLVIWAMTIIVIVSIFLITNENDYLLNAITLVVEVSIGVTISVIVYVYSQKQHDNNQKQGRDIKSILDKIQPIVKDLEHGRIEERKLASQILFLSLENSIKLISYILQLDDKYEQTTTDEQKTRVLTLQQKRIEQIRQTLNGGIDYLDIARIFDAETAAKYDDLRMSVVIAQTFWAQDDYDNKHTDNRAYWESCVKDCETLKDIVKPDDYDNKHTYDRAYWERC